MVGSSHRIAVAITYRGKRRESTGRVAKRFEFILIVRGKTTARRNRNAEQGVANCIKNPKIFPRKICDRIVRQVERFHRDYGNNGKRDRKNKRNVRVIYDVNVKEAEGRINDKHVVEFSISRAD